MGMIKDVVNIAMMIIITIKTQLSGDDSKNVTVDLIQILIIITIKMRRSSSSCGAYNIISQHNNNHHHIVHNCIY
jgi:hypothetical protein